RLVGTACRSSAPTPGVTKREALRTTSTGGTDLEEIPVGPAADEHARVGGMDLGWRRRWRQVLDVCGCSHYPQARRHGRNVDAARFQECATRALRAGISVAQGAAGIRLRRKAHPGAFLRVSHRADGRG